MKPNYLIIIVLIIGIGTVNAAVHLPPTKLSGPEDLSYEVGSTGNELVWSYSAGESNDQPGVYIVTLNDEILEGHNEQSWEDNVPIIVEIDGLAIGEYIYEIEVRDSGYPDQANAAFDDVTVTVVEVGKITSDTKPSPIPLISIFFGIVGISIIYKRKLGA